ncbi:MAG: glycogen debranching enzyme GlgX [Proteobacteria bacterium]|nr:MAG: glycogen debranching enzyme GlgX [Pseudomonadota bacterium]
MRGLRVLPGSPARIGVHWDGEATSFALFSAHATAVELCLFETADARFEAERLPLPERTGDVWHGRFPAIRPGQVYGYRVHGRFAPQEGHRFNAHKLLVDPYAQAITGALAWSDALFGHDPAQPDAPDPRDSAPCMPRAVVVDPRFDWGDDRPPRTPWSRSVLYECHVKGFTQRHPDVSPEQRGRYLGLASPPVVEHLLALGVTALSLLPIQHACIDAHLARLGLPNYWGYNTLGFFAPDARFASGSRGEQVRECKQMVKSLHAAGLEVLIDVVYNHTPEGPPRGPMLSLRGVDNASYYRLRPGDPGEYVDFTGCGNSLNVSHPRVLQLVLDSLRHWVTEFHVDGFRFDLAPVLARDPEAFQRFGRFFEIVRQDPVLAPVKLIAEPWDLGAGGYQLGQFPLGWTEWNGRYRDGVRRAWRGDPGLIGELATRLAGSSDVFDSARGPLASVNFVTCHDGMTLADLVTYARKHNEANGEEGRDGPHDDSHNWGVEGPTRSLRVSKRRERARRNLIATLAFSQGVPMLSHGDELGRTQRGNNNAYCQDNEISWTDWSLDDDGRAFLGFVQRALRLRHANAVFRRRRFFANGDGSEVRWLRRDGEEATPADWESGALACVALWIPAAAADPADEAGRPAAAETVLLLVNPDAHAHAFTLPAPARPGVWHELLNSACETRRRLDKSVVLAPWSLALLAHREPS